MNQSHKFTFTRSEKNTLAICVTLTFLLTFAFSTLVAHFDIKDELKEDASELLLRLESIHSEGAVIAEKLAALPRQTCDVTHRHTMRDMLNRQFFIQSIRYKAKRGMGCVVGEHAAYEGQLSVPNTHSIDITINKNSKFQNGISGIEARHGNYYFVYPATLSPVLLMIDSDYMVFFKPADTTYNKAIYIMGDKTLSKRFTEGLTGWLPEYFLMVEALGLRSDYSVILTYTPEQYLSVLQGWILVILAIAFTTTYMAYRVLKCRYIKQRSLNSRVVNGIKNNQFYCQYQPIVNLESKKVIGCEILARFEDEYGAISPMEFIPEISKADLSFPFTMQILEKAIEELNQEKTLTGPFKVNINVFPEDFITEQLWQYIHRASERCDNFDLVVEITEEQQLDIIRSKPYTRRAQENGIKLALDDFGTGYSNLNNLQEMRYDTLKVDRSFIKWIENQTIVTSLLPNIIDIADKYQMEVVAEGIETEAQLKILQELKVTNGQGWLFGKPMAVGELVKLL